MGNALYLCMSIQCPFNCHNRAVKSVIYSYGRYYRKSDRKWVQRFKCALCFRHFSSARLSPCYRQKKRQLNAPIFKLLASGVSQRKIALLLNTKLDTVARKLKFLGLQARLFNHHFRTKHTNIEQLQFDDMESFEHTKLKPLSITLAVEKGTRLMLGFEVSRMPAKGLLASRSIKKYGYRADERTPARERLFRRLRGQIANTATIESDDNPHYRATVRTHFPNCEHKTYLGARGAITGQGELKKIKHDPLFSLNHTCAMIRYSVNRLIRKTWCTTKKIQPLIDHLDIYAKFHNQNILREIKHANS